MNTVKTYTVEEAKRSIERYCAYQERCHQEVTSKLYNMRMIPEAIDVIMVHLLKHDFLNETRFAQSYVRGKFNIKKWGRQRLKQELKKRDIGKYNIDLAMKEISESDYLETFNALAEKRLKSIERETDKWKKRKKLADYLLYRGWESHLVYDKAAELIP
ncbi:MULTISPECIES: regulatory protein RecX [Bizionia]|uniref:Regulatory protein RecX n=1 Tax=Bizionia algoritergicola TaxID=291187 RepID=A0A5D0R1T0_9FLAO|nr:MULTISPECIES: regulatory protein RecX [Bizionia]OBX23523.1 recombinase RecX [Bizionia sp. APA-3]TYB74945.1 RecX family transcriptional regulator [Bizionia algoritergicola]